MIWVSTILCSRLKRWWSPYGVGDRWRIGRSKENLGCLNDSSSWFPFSGASPCILSYTASPSQLLTPTSLIQSLRRWMNLREPISRRVPNDQTLKLRGLVPCSLYLLLSWTGTSKSDGAYSNPAYSQRLLQSLIGKPYGRESSCLCWQSWDQLLVRGGSRLCLC